MNTITVKMTNKVQNDLLKKGVLTKDQIKKMQELGYASSAHGGGSQWSKEEDLYLEAHYLLQTTAELSTSLNKLLGTNRSVPSVSLRLNQLNLKRDYVGQDCDFYTWYMNKKNQDRSDGKGKVDWQIEPDNLPGVKTEPIVGKRGTKLWIVKRYPKICPFFKKPMIYNNPGGAVDMSASIDQIIPEEKGGPGYAVGNVWIISNLANRMKSNSSKDEMYTFAEEALKIKEMGDISELIKQEY